MKSIFKWIQTMKIAWIKYTAYRFNFFLTVIGPALVFFFIKYNLWSSIYDGDTEAIIGNYNFADMIQYHIWALIVAMIAQGHTAMDMAVEIRHGKISTYLIYPFNFWEFHAASFLAFQVLQIAISGITLSLLYFFGFIENISMSALVNGYGFSILVSFFWFAMQFATGILAFWLDQTWMVRVMLMVITSFLSGAIIPLDFFPSWLVIALDSTPFPYITYYPIQLFMGKASLSITAVGSIIIWFVGLCIFNNLLWRSGMKRYTAAGM